MGVFSKVSKGFNKTFDKVDKGFKTFAKGANDVVDKVGKGVGQAEGQVNLGLRKGGNTFKAVGGNISKYADLASPFLTAVNPELGQLAGSVSQGGKMLKQTGIAMKQARGNVSDFSGRAQSGLMKAKMDPNAFQDQFA